MNNLQENDRIVEERIPRLIYLDQQLATVNAQLQHLSGSRQVRRNDGRRLNAERQLLNAERQRLVGDIQLHQPQHLQRITRQIPSIDSDDLSQVTTILDIPFSPSSSIYGPGSPIYGPGSPPGSPPYAPGSAISTSPNSPTWSQGSLHMSDLNTSDNDIIDVVPTPPGSPIITPPTRSRRRGPVGGTKKKKGKKRKATKKKKVAKKGKKTKKR